MAPSKFVFVTLCTFLLLSVGFSQEDAVEDAGEGEGIAAPSVPKAAPAKPVAPKQAAPAAPAPPKPAAVPQVSAAQRSLAEQEAAKVHDAATARAAKEGEATVLGKTLAKLHARLPKNSNNTNVKKIVDSLEDLFEQGSKGDAEKQISLFKPVVAKYSSVDMTSSSTILASLPKIEL